MIDEMDYYRDVDIPIFNEEFSDWLPSLIFDVHTHTWLPEHLLRPIAEERVSIVYEATSLPWQELASDYQLLFPGKEVEWLAFGNPLTVIDREANNRYVAEQIDNVKTYGLYVPRLDEDASAIWNQIQAGRFIGLKPYMSYVTWKELEAIRVVDFVKPAMLEVANEYGLVVMLHVPRNRRLADPENLLDLKYIAVKYPNAQFILAHAGRAYGRSIMEAGVAELGQIQNIRYDLSNVQDYGAIRALLELVSLDHIMYGTDMPVASVRGLMIMINGQRVCITRKQFPWSISSKKPRQLRCTFMGYEGLRAIKQACTDLGIGRVAIEGIFYSNAKQLCNNLARSLEVLTKEKR
jgi:glutamate-1-semialdehyde 2,1-aminomutase